MKTWLRRSRRAPRGSAPAGPRPAVERLEDRRVPAVDIAEFAVPFPGRLRVDHVAPTPDGGAWASVSDVVTGVVGGSQLFRVAADGGMTYKGALPYVSALAAGPDDTLWYATQTAIGRVTATGERQTFFIDDGFRPLQTPPNALAAAPDGGVWFTVDSRDVVGRVGPDGTMSILHLPKSPVLFAYKHPWHLTVASDGAAWFTEVDANAIGRIGPEGLAEYPLPPGAPFQGPTALTAGPDGDVWYAREGALGRMTVGGGVVEFPLPAGVTRVADLTTDGAGNVWLSAAPFAHGALGYTTLARMSPAGAFEAFAVPTPGFLAPDLTTASDGTIWFAGDASGQVGHVTFDATPVTPGESTGSALGTAVTLTPEQQYVGQLYQDLLGRDAGLAETRLWANALTRGTGRAEVARRIASSPEAHAFIVDGLYQEVLDRGADAAGTSFFGGFLDRGGSADAVRAALYGSDEYWNRHGGQSGFVAALYSDTLGRGVDAEGQRYWDGVVAQGTPRATVVAALLGSDEGRTATIDGFYRRYLDRAGDAGGLAAFLAASRRGADEATLIAALVASDEYRQ